IQILHTMATCIVIDEDNGHMISDISTQYSNSDHLLLECTLQNRSVSKGPHNGDLMNDDTTMPQEQSALKGDKGRNKR
ncbi:6393_t:CDS:1, partial [Gigaspora rosea]